MVGTRKPLRQINALLTSSECRGLLQVAERTGFLPARMLDHGRVNEEVFINAARWSSLFQLRLRRRHIKTVCDDIVEVYRYKPGSRLAPHLDLPRPLACGTESNATLVVYLSEGFEGGVTRFPELEFDAKPQLGGAILFAQSLKHEATPVTRGVKLTARMDLALL